MQPISVKGINEGFTKDGKRAILETIAGGGQVDSDTAVRAIAESILATEDAIISIAMRS
jgi:hypothetical protein